MKSLKFIIAGMMISLLFISCGGATKDSTDEKTAADFGSSKINAAVVAVTGRATVIRSGSRKTIKNGMALQEGDRIQTMLGSKVDIKIRNRGVISLRNNTVFILNKLQIDKGIKVELKEGKLLCALKKLEKGKSFSVSTPTGIAGIRGTSFVMSTEKGTSKLSVLTGKIEIKNNSGQTVIVEEKKQIHFDTKKIDPKTSIRGSSIAEVKELLQIKGVEYSGELSQMQKNIKALSIEDEKTGAEDISINRDFKSQDIKTTKQNVTVKESQKTTKTSTIEDQTEKFGDDADMMIK